MFYFIMYTVYITRVIRSNGRKDANKLPLRSTTAALAIALVGTTVVFRYTSLKRYQTYLVGVATVSYTQLAEFFSLFMSSWVRPTPVSE